MPSTYLYLNQVQCAVSVHLVIKQFAIFPCKCKNINHNISCVNLQPQFITHQVLQRWLC